MPNDNDNTNTPAPDEIAPEWRELGGDDVIEPGDISLRIDDPDSQWLPAICIGKKVSDVPHCRFRRQIPKAINQLGEEPGYRRIGPKEPVLDGDEGWSPFCTEWAKANSSQVGRHAGDVGWGVWRRRIAPAPAAAPVSAEPGEVERLRAELAAHQEMESNFIELGIAARGLVEKLDQIDADDSYKSVFMVAAIHGQQYTGPDYRSEFLRLKELLPQYSSVPEMVAAMQKDASLSEENDRLRAELATPRADRDREIAVAVAFEADAAKLRIARVEAERDEARRSLDAVVRGLERVVWSNPSPTIPVPPWPIAPAPYYPPFPPVTYTGDPLPPMPETVCGAGKSATGSEARRG